MIEACGGQLRMAAGPNRLVAYGLDFPAVLAMARAMGADETFVADLLGDVEPLVMAAVNTGDGDA